MYKMVLENIAGVEIWAIIALIIFFTIFVGVSVRAIRMKKSDAQEMASMPLDPAEKSTTNGE